ncbi:MAG TPA: hypothetical protein VKV06_11915 [Acidimicrobiales bacterium]|nr:hypothetical protein [Acidimicrobiales bacterium]
MRGFTRRRGLALVALAGSAMVAGCGPVGRVPLQSDAARTRLASTVLATVDDYGIPVDSDAIVCSPTHRPHRVACHGETANEPTAAVVGVFTAGGGGRCAGRLSITIGDAPLTTLRDDPCR